jgi:glutamyl-tRNA synthetase
MADLVEPRFRARGWNFGSRERLEKIAILFRERARTLLELDESAKFLFEPIAFDPAGVAKFLTPAIAPVLDDAMAQMASLHPFTHDTIKPVFEALLAKYNIKMVAIAQACRVSISGGTVSPPIFEVMEILGKEETLRRLKEGRAKIAGG